MCLAGTECHHWSVSGSGLRYICCLAHPGTPDHSESDRAMNTCFKVVGKAIDYLTEAIVDPVEVHRYGLGGAAHVQAEIDRITLLRPARTASIDLLVPSHSDNRAVLLRAHNSNVAVAVCDLRTGESYLKIARHFVAPYAPAR